MSNESNSLYISILGREYLKRKYRARLSNRKGTKLSFRIDSNAIPPGYH